jgi:hypothetical protein
MLLRDTTKTTALTRLGRSLVSWWEIPAFVMLRRGDFPRFAHGIATSARQLVAAVARLNDAEPRWDSDFRIQPADFRHRLETMTSLSDSEESGKVADTLVEETLGLMAQRDVPDVDSRLGRWTGDSLPTSMSVDGAVDIARTVFERGRSISAVAVLVADSWARGMADDASDIDVRLIVHHNPTLEMRRHFLEPLSARSMRQYGDEAYITADQFVLTERKVDVKYHTVDRLHSALVDPFRLGGPIDLLELFDTHVVAADPFGAVAELANISAVNLHTRAAEVAEASSDALRVVTSTLPSCDTASEAMALALGPGFEYLVRLWAGLNGRIHAFPKWLDLVTREFAIGPFDAQTRIKTICMSQWDASSVSQRLREWTDLVEEFSALAQRNRSRGRL